MFLCGRKKLFMSFYKYFIYIRVRHQWKIGMTLLADKTVISKFIN